MARRRIFGVFAAPIQAIALRQRQLCVDLLHGIAHRTGQIASFNRELNSDVARIVLAINERGAARYPDVCELLERNLLSAGRRHEDVADLLRAVAVLALEANDQIELFLFLYYAGGDVSADRCLNQRIDVSDVQTITGNPRTVDVDRQTRLPEFLHQGYFTYSAHLLQDFFDRFAFFLKQVQIGAE